MLRAIDFACNDPANGLFAGRAIMVSFGENEMAAPDFDRGFAFTEGNDFIRIHRRKFTFVRSREWHGNWCWNRYYFTRSEAKRLLRTLRENGWGLDAGSSHFWNWWRTTPIQAGDGNG